MGDTISTTDVEERDADTLGGTYRASDITTLNTNLGVPSDASAVTGSNAFLKINSLNETLTTLTNNKSAITVGNSFSLRTDIESRNILHICFCLNSLWNTTISIPISVLSTAEQVFSYGDPDKLFVQIKITKSTCTLVAFTVKNASYNPFVYDYYTM